MKIGLYDPYLDTLGGGEKYLLTIASCLSDKNHITLFWDDPQILDRAEKRFNLSFSNIEVVSNVFAKKVSTTSRYIQTKDLDAIFMISDGSIPLVGSKKLFLIFQFAMPHLKFSLADKIKLRKVSYVICYSKFVKRDLEKQFGKKVIVLYPPVDTMETNETKENKILTVGRFTKSNNAKKQDVLIDAFKKLYDTKKTNWEFHLAGSFLAADEDLVEKLKHESKNYPIFFHTNITFAEIKSLYGKSKIYWHAAGFGEDLNKHPERAEHFGISTVEAMSAGCVPIVIKAGGQKEIVDDGKNGYLWSTTDELIERTEQLMDNAEKLEALSVQAKERAKAFSLDTFCSQLQQLL